MGIPSERLCEETKTQLPKLRKGRLIRRINRFVAEIELYDGSLIKAHCPNSGSMLTCSEPGRLVFVSEKEEFRGKLRYTWELIDMGTSLVGINTLVPNRLIFVAVSRGLIPDFQGYNDVKREVRFNHHRIDIMATNPQRPLKRLWVEVKNCTLVMDGTSYFPDAVTTRGQRHVKALMALRQEGHEAAMVFVVQRQDAHCFKPADFIDPVYALLLREASEKGVKVMAFGCEVTPRHICLKASLPVRL